jgi:hypothetical protein
VCVGWNSGLHEIQFSTHSDPNVVCNKVVHLDYFGSEQELSVVLRFWFFLVSFLLIHVLNDKLAFDCLTNPLTEMKRNRIAFQT